jgi:hypothetical protein
MLMQIFQNKPYQEGEEEEVKCSAPEVRQK